MNKLTIVAVLAVGVTLGYSGHAWTQTNNALPMAGEKVAAISPAPRNCRTRTSTTKSCFR